MNNRFPVLSTISKILRVLGWSILILSFTYAVIEGLIEPNLPGHSFARDDAFQLAGGLLASVIGLIVAVCGEVIGVLFAIEENTRKAATALSAYAATLATAEKIDSSGESA